MSRVPDKPQDKTNGRGGKEYLLNNRDLIVIAASVFIVFLAMIVYNSLKGNNISCVCCNDTEESKVHCKGLKKIDLLEERIEELTKELKDTKQSIKEQGEYRLSQTTSCFIY